MNFVQELQKRGIETTDELLKRLFEGKCNVYRKIEQNKRKIEAIKHENERLKTMLKKGLEGRRFLLDAIEKKESELNQEND